MIIQSAERWAQFEFGDARLGDARRTARAVKVARALAKSPGGTLPEPIPLWAEVKAAYSLLSNRDVTFERLQQPHWTRTQEACGARGEYLLIEDTTALDYTSHKGVEELGRIGDNNGRGFYVHTTLAARVERWTAEQDPVLNLQGLFWQQVWARNEPPKKGRETKLERLSRPRESQRWAKAFDQGGGPPAGVNWTYIADRESDIAEVFIKTREYGIDFIVRACWPRGLEMDEPGTVFDAAARGAVKGSFEIHLRARPGQPARTATVQVRAREVTVRGPWRPDGALPAQTVNVVEILEIGAPKDVEPLKWVLLTSWPCETLAQCLKIARGYAARWLIEEYHKALKSGTGIEQSQLETVRGLHALLAVLAIVAVRLLGLKLIARAEPDKSVPPGLLGQEAFAVLSAKFGKPKEGWTSRTTLVSIARLGGFLARRGDGDPGWLTIWRGWRRLVLLTEGFELKHGRYG